MLPKNTLQKSSRCLVIPAIKKNAVIPDQLVKKLAGKTLIQRALDTAKQVVPDKDIWVITDSDEIRLICNRNNVQSFYDASFHITSLNIIQALHEKLCALSTHYENIIIYRASAPLITPFDINDAYAQFVASKTDCLVTVKSVKQRLWKEHNDTTTIDALLFNDEKENAYAEAKSLFMLQSKVLTCTENVNISSQGQTKAHNTLSASIALTTTPASTVHAPASTVHSPASTVHAPASTVHAPASTVHAPAPTVHAPAPTLTTTPYFLNDRSVEINSYQDWWICEKILQSKHIVFVVAGYAEIGMGHIYRALMLAHEIADHRITFLCTKESELAASNIAARDYRTRVQQSANLAEDVLHLRPHMVINDILNTSKTYIQQLKSSNIPVINFEDEGEGANLADFVVNALYPPTSLPNSKKAYGSKYFCLRDEFLQAEQNSYRPTCKRMLITFGGTDPSNFTRHALDAIVPFCQKHNIAITIVAGPGYAHVHDLEQHINMLQKHLPTHTIQGTPAITFTHTTNSMSQKMEHIDCAIASAGRTVFELAHMHIPALILSQHIREDTHTFACPENGFLFIPYHDVFQKEAVITGVEQLCDPKIRKQLFTKLTKFDFTQNKTRVVQSIINFLPTTNEQL